MDRREIEHLLQAIHRSRQIGQPLALATVVRVRGSAYRREGTRMVVRTDGTYECALSGGCLEAAVANAAAGVIATGEPVIVSYDLADESIWALGIGCSGAVDIRIERFEEDPVSNEWLQILDRGEAAVLVTSLSGAAGRMIIRSNGKPIGEFTDRQLEKTALDRAHMLLRARSSQSGAEWVNGAELFFEVMAPVPELTIFGAGDDVVPIARLAWSLGFTVTVVDSREAFLAEQRFPSARRVRAHFSEFAGQVHLSPATFVLVMNHHVERDQESLRFALESDAVYIGVLGPRSRYEMLLEGLAQRGYVPASSKLARVRSPVGLALGAETPQEVAVSILAEVLALQHGFVGGFLSGSTESLHRREDMSILARS